MISGSKWFGEVLGKKKSTSSSKSCSYRMPTASPVNIPLLTGSYILKWCFAWPGVSKNSSVHCEPIASVSPHPSPIISPQESGQSGQINRKRSHHIPPLHL